MSALDQPASDMAAGAPEESQPEQPAERPERTFREGAALLARSAREEPRVFTVALLGSSAYAVTTVLAATVLGHVTDATILPSLRTGHVAAGALVGAVLAILAVALVKSIGITVRRLGAGVMQYRLQATYRRRVTRQYLRLPLRWHQQHSTGELLANANSDVEAMFWPVAPFPFACGIAVMLVATAVQLIAVDTLLALVGFCVFPLIFVLNAVYNRVQSATATRAQELRGQVSSVAHESFDGALVVKTLGREADETERFRVGAEQLRDANISLGRMRGLFDPLMEALPSIGVLVVLYVGSLRLAAGAITAGDLVKVSYLFVQLALPVRAIGWVLSDLPRAVVGDRRVRRVLRATGALPFGSSTLPAPTGGPVALRVDATDVRFAYEAGTPVLQGVDLDVAPGRTVAVVGATGAGKSTLASLLVRLADPDAGSVAFDGVDVREFAAGQVSGAASFVPQTTFVFDDTVRGNVALGADATDDAIWAALRLAQAEAFVGALPRGLDTLVGERGTTLSGGQRQRLALARALVRRPRLLVLDDATSSVDPSVEAAILRAVRDAGVSGDLPSTVVVVAYRQATILLADEVLFVEGGRVVARGTHDALLAASPGYRELVTAYSRAAAERDLVRAS